MYGRVKKIFFLRRNSYNILLTAGKSMISARELKEEIIALAATVSPLLNIYGKGESKQVEYHKIQLSSELINRREDHRKCACGVTFKRNRSRGWKHLRLTKDICRGRMGPDGMGETNYKASCFNVFLNNHQMSVSTPRGPHSQ